MAVRCPDCGSTNDKENKFCSSCGFKLLPDTAGRCPQCSASNPISNIFCDECGARLVPARPVFEKDSESSVRGLSLPRKEPSVEDSAPDWLAQLRTGFSDTLAEPPDDELDSPQAPSPLLQDGSAPLPLDEGRFDWPRDITESAPEAEAGKRTGEDQVPAWLQEALEDTGASPESEHVASLFLPDVLESIPGTDPQDVDTDEFPAWLADLSPEVKTPPPADESPGWLQEVLAAEAAPEPSPDAPAGGIEIEPGELPDWLKDTAAKTFEPSPKLEETRSEPPAPLPIEAEADELSEWLQDAAAGKAAPIPPTVSPGDDLPDWLRDLVVDQAAPEVAAPEPLADAAQVEPGELPDWLQDFAAVEQAAPEVVAPAPTHPIVEAEDEAGGLPDWLQEVVVDETTPSSPAGEKETELGELPDWLREIAAGDRGAAEPLIPEQPPVASLPEKAPRRQPSPPATGALTDWLGAAAQPADGEVSSTPPGVTGPLAGTGPLVPPELPDWLAAVSDSAEGALPDWLTMDDSDTAALPAPGPTPGLAAETRTRTGPLPSWLSPEDAGVAEPERPPLEAAPPPAEELVDLPDWLKAATKGISAPDGAIGAAELPDWLVAAEGLDLERAPFEDGIAPADALGLAQADIPEWLQALKPKKEVSGGPEDVDAAELEPAEAGGPLDGVRGALVAEMVVVASPVSGVLPKFMVTEEQQAHVQVLEQIVHADIAAKPEVTPAQRPYGWLEQGLIPILLFLAVFLPVLLGNPLVAITGEESVAQEISDAYYLLEVLPDSALVVVAFDYGPAAAGELDPIAATMVQHLMSRRARILTVSTVPAGPEIAQTLLGKLAGEYGYTYGTDYLNLGYIPGGAAGLHSFATAPWKLFAGADYLGRERAEQDGRDGLARNNPAAGGLTNSLAEVNQVIFLTADRDDLVGWIEQVGRLPGMERVPMAAGVSAGLEAWAQPYVQSDPKQLNGLVSGIPGAAQYEQRANQSGISGAVKLRNSQTVGLFVIILFIVIGLLWGTAVGLDKRRRGDE